MIIGPRRVVLLVALCVLASAATASAECAWVLWFGTVLPGPEQWRASDAYQTRKECLESLEQSVEATKRTGGQVFWRAGMANASWRDGTGNPGVHQCLPDTVDPRRPKVK